VRFTGKHQLSQGKISHDDEQEDSQTVQKECISTRIPPI